MIPLLFWQREPERRTLVEIIESADSIRMSVASFVEISIVIESKYGAEGLRDLDRNYGDCFSYAAAMSSGEPLFFKGDDFIHTDVTILEVGNA